jgi:hypothetical protein
MEHDRSCNDEGHWIARAAYRCVLFKDALDDARLEQMRPAQHRHPRDFSVDFFEIVGPPSNGKLRSLCRHGVTDWELKTQIRLHYA